MVVLGALGDDTGDAAGGILLQLGKAGLEVDAVAQLLNVLLQGFVALQPGSRLAGAVVVLLHGVEIIGVVLGVLGGPSSLSTRSKLALPAELIFQNAAHEIVHGSRLVDPSLDNALVTLAGSIAGDLAQQLGLIGRGGTGGFGSSGVDGAVPVAGVLHYSILLDDAEVQAVGGCISGGKHTAVACAHDEDVGVHGLGDGGLVDIRLLAQPIGLVAGGQLDAGHGGFALGLCKAALGGLHDSLGGHGGAGHSVDLGRTGSQQLLLELVCSGSAVGSGLAGGIDHYIGHSAVGEGHGDLDGGGNALCGALIGAGDVGAGGGRCAGSGGGGAGGVAGSQCTGGNTGHGRSGRDLQKTFARDLVHCGSSFLLFFVCSSFAFCFNRIARHVGPRALRSIII